MDDTFVEVLVVDDVRDVAESLAEYLRLDGYGVDVAFTATQALEKIGQKQPHCVVLDFGLPDMDGLEFAKRLREQYGDDIVLIAITGRDLDEARVVDAFARVDHYFVKPVSDEQLRKALPRQR